MADLMRTVERLELVNSQLSDELIGHIETREYCEKVVAAGASELCDPNCYPRIIKDCDEYICDIKKDIIANQEAIRILKKTKGTPE